HPQTILHDVVGLADELHVAVFDAVVGHLHVMAGPAFAHPVTAGRAIGDLRGDGLENWFDVRLRGRRTAGHDARAMTRAFLATAHAGADVKQALAFDVFGAADGVLEQRVPAVNDDVAGF